MPLDNVDEGDPDARDVRAGLGSSSDHGVRYVVHRVMSGERLAVLSTGHCTNASLKKRYRGVCSISFDRRTSSLAFSRSSPPGAARRGVDLDEGECGWSPSSTLSPGASAKRYVVNNTTAFTRSSFGGLYAY